MAKVNLGYHIFVNAKQQKVYDYVSDFSRHGEWSAGLNVEPVSDGPTIAGSEYKSVGKQLGKQVENSLKVTECDAPKRLCFVSSDGKAEFLNEIDFIDQAGGTLLERQVSFDANPVLKLMFKAVIGPLVANPSMNKSLRKLRDNVEQNGS